MLARPSYALIGLFVLLLGGAVFAVVVWLSATIGQTSQNEYLAYMGESVAGLNVKAAVRYRGVEVGRVKRIALDRDNPLEVELLLAIDQGTPIKEDTEATLATQGITGLAYIELSGGRSQSPPLQAKPGQLLPVIRTIPSLFERIDQAAPRLLEQVERTTLMLATASERIGTLFSDRNQAAIASILGNLQQVAAILGSRAVNLGDGLDRIDRMLVTTEHAVGRLPPVIAQTETTLRQLAATGLDISEAAQEFKQLAERVDRLVSAVRDGPLQDAARVSEIAERELERISSQTQPQLLALMSDLQTTSATLRRLAEGIDRDPSMLLFGRRNVPPGPGEE